MAIPDDLIITLTGANLSEIIEHLDSKNRHGCYGKLTLQNEIKPCDIYCYLIARFGSPNGIQSFLKSDDSDNLIHWDWTLRYKDGWITFLGANFRTEILFKVDFSICNSDIPIIVEQLKSNFASYGKKMSEIRKSLENWIEFVNPFCRIQSSINKLLLDIRALELKPEDETNPQINYSSRIDPNLWEDLLEKYSKGLGLCFGVRSMLPVMAEAFVNLILFVLMKQELKSDLRLKENIIRQPIDIRVKSLHINCIGFDQPIDYAHPICKAYHSLVNERNDLLHGNVVLDKLKFNEVYFDSKVPVFKQYRSVWERSIGVEIQSVGLHRLENEVQTVEKFISYLKSCMNNNIRQQFDIISKKRDLGINSANGCIGILFPNHLVDFFVD